MLILHAVKLKHFFEKNNTVLNKSTNKDMNNPKNQGKTIQIKGARRAIVTEYQKAFRNQEYYPASL